MGIPESVSSVSRQTPLFGRWFHPIYTSDSAQDLEDLAGHEPGVHRETLWLLD
jgi:hypothetical protein